jgi:hypothetical protein
MRSAGQCSEVAGRARFAAKEFAFWAVGSLQEVAAIKAMRMLRRKGTIYHRGRICVNLIT